MIDQMPRMQDGFAQANFSLPRDLLQKAKNLRINVSAVCRRAVEEAVAPKTEPPLHVRLQRLAREAQELAAAAEGE